MFTIELECEKCGYIEDLEFTDKAEYLEVREKIACWECEGGVMWPTTGKRWSRKDFMGCDDVST